jgi:hypothetical protein
MSASAEENSEVTDVDDYWVRLTARTAHVARETLADVATPTGSLGTLADLDDTHATVDVGNPLADDYGSTRHAIADLSVGRKTIDYWISRGYLKASDLV